ncbi:hypothetical protein DYB32_007694, partial [Aphanomyces invadans]
MTAQALVAAIVAKGDEIRQLKSDKKDFQAQLAELKKLKDEYKSATGEEYKPPAAPKAAKAAPEPSKADGEKSKSQLKKEKKLAEKAAASSAPKEKAASKKPAKPSATAKPVDATAAIPSGVDLVMRQAKYAHHTALHGASSGQKVTPWEVEAEGGVDYEKLVDTFGCSKLTQDLVDRVEKLTGVRAHRYLRRGYFFAHREFNEILDLYEKGQKFYLYTGRGPSSGSLHLGHLIPFSFTAWLQKAFNVPLVIQLTDDEKFLFKDQTLDESEKMAWENSKDIIACGFDPKKTFIFRNADYIDTMYPEILKIQKCVTYNQVRGIFGFSGSDNIGKSAFPAVQACPSFPQTFPIPFSGRTDLRCLIPCAIDQDPYFRMTRDVAPRIGYQKPTLIFSKFFPANASATIYISDSADVVADKIRRFAFSGGGETKADHEKYGANLDVDIPFQYLTFMLEDDAELAQLAEEYGSGRMMSGVVKDRLIQVMTDTNAAFQAKRAAITDDQIREFMRTLQAGGPVGALPVVRFFYFGQTFESERHTRDGSLQRMAVPWVLLLAAGVAFGQKCKLSTTITKAPGVLVDRMPQTQGTYEPSTDCHWKISTASPNKVVQLDVDIVDLTMDVYNDVLLINLGVDAAVPQGWSRYSRNTDIMGQDNVGAFDYTSTIPGSCTSVQGSSFDPMTCSLTDGSLLTDRRRDGSWIYFTGAGNGIVPFTLVSMAPDVFIVFRSFAKMNSVNDGNTGVSGVRISYSFVSAYCDGATVLTPRLEATDANSVSMEMQIKDNMAGTTKPNMNCSWLLQPFRDGAARVPFDSIWLDFRTFDLKGGAIVSMYELHPDCGSLNPALMTCTRTKASSSVVAYDGAAGRLFSGDCAYCPLPPAITGTACTLHSMVAHVLSAVQPQLPNVDWDGNALEQSCPDVFQCPHGTQCSPTGMCTKVADAAPPDISIRRQCTSSTDCPDATVCNAQHICEAPANYALRLTSATTATVCSIYGIPSTPDFTVELRLQVLSPPVGNDILVQHPDLAIKRSSGLTITVGMSPPWITAVNVADGHWHSIVWVWANAAGTMSVYEMSATNDAMLVASTTSISPNVPLSANQNVTLGPMDGAISFMRMWTEVRPVATFFQPSPDRLHLLAEYRFMEGSSRDLSANQNDMATPTLSFGAYPPSTQSRCPFISLAWNGLEPYDCVASPFTIPNGLAVGAVVAVTATSTRPWRIGVFNSGNVRVLAVTGSTNLVDIAVDGASVATIAVAEVTAKALLIRLHRTSSTEIEVCVNDVACKTITAPSTAMAYVAVNTAPYAGPSAGLQSPCLVHVESLAALAPIVSVPTKTVDGADCDFPFAISSRSCNAFSTYLATKAYTEAAFVPLAQAYALGHHLDSADEECQCDDMPTWSTNFKISQVDSATPTTIVATVDYIKIKTRINDPGGGGIQCGATCYMLEVPGHRRLAGGPPGPPPTSTTPPPPPPPGPTPASVPVYDSGTLARMYNVKRDFVFVDNAGSWSVQSATADGIVSSTNCLITGPDASQVVESLTSFSCQTLGDTTMDAPSLPYCILHNAKKTCQSDYDGCSLTNGAATMTSLDGSFSDNYKGSITTGVHVCAFHVQPAVPEPLRQYANVSYTIQTAELSASDELQVTDSAGRPLGPAISGPVAFADLPTKAMVSGLAATFTLRTAGDKTSNTNDGFVVEYDTMYSFPDAATAHFCGAAQTSMTVSGATIFPTTSFATAVAYPALANCTYVLRAPPASYSSIWLDFLDFSMASTSDRMELYDADTSPPTLLAAFTNTTYALPHYGIVFTGQADYILSSSSLAALPRTVVFWIQVPVTVQKDCTVANACTNNVAKKMKVLGTEFKSSAACAKFNVELDVDTGFLSMFLNGANHVIEQDVRQGSWLHVALVYRELDNVMFGYLNGVRVAMSAVTGVFNPSLPPCSSDVLFLGGQPSLPDDRNVFFNGMLRQVALYADAKTIYHVGRLMGRPCDATDAALLVCYAFTSIDASTATDDSSYELHGRFHGTSLYTQNPLQLSSLLHKTFTSASATVIVRYFPTSANSTFRFLAMPKVCPPCASHGTCRRGQCHCDSGYTGATCNMVVDACPQDVLVPSKKGVLVFPTKAPTVGHFVPSVPSGGYPAALDCSFHLRKSSSKIVLTFAKLDLDESDAIMVYEGRRESPRYLASHNLTADVAMDSASYFSRGAYGYSRVIFKNVSAYDATAVLWPVVAAPQPGNCSKTFHVVKYRRGMACADATSVGLNQTWAAHLISSYWWLESPEAFSTQITPRRLVFNDYTADAATVTTEFTKLVLGQGKVTRPHPGVFRFRRRTQPFTTCQDGSSEGLDIVSLVEATGTHTFSRPDAAVGYQQAPIVSPVFRYAGTWSLDTSKPFSGVFRSPGFVPQVGSSPFTIVVRATVALTSEVQYLFAQEDNPASSIFLKISESRRGLGKWTFGAYATNDKATPASPASFSRDTIMLAITFNNGVVSYYVNGVLFGTHDTDASYQACVDQCILDDTDPWWECRNQEPMYNFGHSNRLVMGGRFQGSTVLNPWKGQILELSVYDMALPDAVVASLFTGVGAISSSVSKFSVNSFASPTQGEASTIEVLTVPVGNDQQASSTFIRRWHVHRYACATPAPSLDTPHLATILNASSALTKVVYNAMDDTAALVSWSTASSPFVQTSLVRSKSYGHGLTATAIVDLLVEYGLANDNFPYVVTAVFVTAITSTSASVGFRFLDAQRQIVEATATLPRVNNTWTHPTAVHRLTVPPYGVLPPTKCRDDRDSTVPLTDTSGILSDGGATESSIVAPNTQCSWVLRAPVGETITISFTYFFIDCMEGDLTIDDVDAHTSTPLCGSMAGWSATFGANVRLNYHIGPPPMGMNNHPMPMMSTGFFGQYVFSNDNPVLDTTEGAATFGPWTVAAADAVRPGSTQCQVDTNDEAPSYEWKIQESSVQTNMDDTCYQTQLNDADFEWEVESFDLATGDTIQCKDDKWVVDETMPWTAVAMDRVGGTERYTDPPTTVEHAPAFNLTKATQSLAATYVSERNALQVRIQSSAGGRGRAVIEYYMPQIYYVAPASYQGVDGSNGDGSREMPFTHSFQYLMANVLASGDMLRLYPGRYEGTGYCNLVWTEPVVMESISGPEWTVLDCNGLSRGWQLKHASGLSILKGITFTHTMVSSTPFTGAAVLASGDVHIESCVFDSNVHRAQGTLAIVAPSVSKVVNCSFVSNSGLSGPAIAVLSATATLDAIRAVDNFASVSGALFVSTYVEGATMSLSSPSRVVVSKSVFLRNKGSKEGALTVARSSVVDVTSCEFIATAAAAIAVDASTLKLDKSIMQGNLGSGILASNAALVVATSSTFAGNAAKSGAAVSLDASSYQGRGNAYTGNTATVAGGAIYGQGCHYTEVDSSFVGNAVGNATNAIGGGALAFTSSNSAVDSATFQVVVQRCLLQSNAATFGGAMQLGDVHAALVSNQFVRNSAGRFGGAIRVANCMAQRDEVVLDVRDNDFNGNTAGRGAAAYVEASDVVQFVANTFRGNSAASFGGAIAVVATSRVQITTSTFQGCVSSGGGAVYAASETTLDIVDSTFAQCSSRSHGGSVYVENSQLALANVNVQG